MECNTWKLLVKGCKSIPEKDRFKPTDEVLVEEIGDGNLNDVLRVYAEDGHSIIVKHSIPYIKCLGEGYPLTENRIDYEYRALSKFQSLSPGSVPRPLAFDKDHNAVYMEDLRGYTIFRELLMNGEFDMQIVVNLARHLAEVHRETHLEKLGQDAIKELDKYFDNTDMVALSEQYIFTKPFIKDDETNKCCPEVGEKLDMIYGDEQVLSAANDMKQIFTQKKECLLHGDLHAGSVMVKGTDSRMIDIEFACVGPASFDVGLLIASFVFGYHRHMCTEEDNDKHRDFAFQMIEAAKTFVTTYLEHMVASVGNREAYVHNLLSEIAGFAGCEVIRRLIGAAHYPYLDGMPLAEQDCLGAGIRLLQAKNRIHDIDRLMVIALMLV